MYKWLRFFILAGVMFLPLHAMEKMEAFLQDTKDKEWSVQLQQQFDDTYQSIQLKKVLKVCKQNSSWQYKKEFKNRMFERCNTSKKSGSEKYKKYQRFLQYVGWSNDYRRFLALEIEKNKVVKKAQELQTVQGVLQELGPDSKRLWNFVMATEELKAKWLGCSSGKYTKERVLNFLQGSIKDLQKIIMRVNVELDGPMQEIYRKQLRNSVFRKEDQHRQFLLRLLNRRYSSLLRYARDNSDFNQYTEYPYGRMCPPYSISLIQKFVAKYPPDPTHYSLDPEKFIYRLNGEQIHELYKQHKKEMDEYKQCIQKWVTEKREFLSTELKKYIKETGAVTKENGYLITPGREALAKEYYKAVDQHPNLNPDIYIENLCNMQVCNLYKIYKIGSKRKLLQSQLLVHRIDDNY